MAYPGEGQRMANYGLKGRTPEEAAGQWKEYTKVILNSVQTIYVFVRREKRHGQRKKQFIEYKIKGIGIICNISAKVNVWSKILCIIFFSVANNVYAVLALLGGSCASDISRS